MKSNLHRLLFGLLVMVPAVLSFATADPPAAPVPISPQEYTERRSRVEALLDRSEILLLFGAGERVRSRDIEYPFRQHSDFLYLTGYDEPGGALLISPALDQPVFFLPASSHHHQVWTGPRLDAEAVRLLSGFEDIRPMQELADVLENLMPVDDTLYLGGGTPRNSLGETDARERFSRESATPPDSLIASAAGLLMPLRMVKSPAELALMQRAIDISIDGHRAAKAAASPGTTEYELEAAMEHAFRRLGGSGPAYPSIVGSAGNGCILHYTRNDRQTVAGDLVLMDCGAEYQGYAADITRTFPVSREFSPEQRILYDLVLRAQEAAIRECRAGNDFRDPHQVAREIISEGLLELGIMKKKQQIMGFFPHGTSHYLGLDVHDVGDYRRLSPGHVITVEPGVYIPAGSDCDERWWNIGIRIEDIVLITDGDPVVMSAALEK